MPSRRPTAQPLDQPPPKCRWCKEKPAILKRTVVHPETGEQLAKYLTYCEGCSTAALTPPQKKKRVKKPPAPKQQKKRRVSDLKLNKRLMGWRSSGVQQRLRDIGNY